MGMTLWSLEMYGYIDSKTKSYQIQKDFLLLFIFLPSRPWPSNCMPSDSIFPAICHQNFCIFGGTHCSPKFQILDPFYNLNPYLLSFLLTIKMSTSLAAIGLTKYQGVVLDVFNNPCLLPLIWWFQRFKAMYRLKTLSCNYASYWLRLGLAIR